MDRRTNKLKVGDRVVVPFASPAANAASAKRDCGHVANESNRNAERAGENVGPLGRRWRSDIRTLPAVTPAGQRNTSAFRSLTFGPTKVPAGLTDEQVLFLTDIFPTGYMAAENCDIEGPDRCGFGCGPVGLFVIMSRLCSVRAGYRHRL